MNSQTPSKASAISMVFIASMLVGCGGSSALFTPDLTHPVFQSPPTQRENVRIVKVTDDRPKKSSRIGITRVGVLNERVPLLLNGEFEGTVKSMLDALMVGDQHGDRSIPLSVSVDLFEVGLGEDLLTEKGYFACTFRFSYPITGDSIGQGVVSVRQMANDIVDSTDMVGSMIYRGMAGAVQRFLLDKNREIASISADSLTAFESADSLFFAEVEQEPEEKPFSRGLAIWLVRGDKIDGGIRVNFAMLTRGNDPKLLWGFGLGLTFLDVINTVDRLKGVFFGFGGRFIGRYYFSEAPTSAYIGGTLSLASGSEIMNNESTFFFGPAIEETFGLTIGRSVSIEAGMFQLAHFGSKLLPSDIGFVFGVSLGL